MRLTVNTQELNAAISVVTKALGARSAVSILEGIYMEAIGSTMLLKCTDLSLQIEATLGADIEKDGVVVLPGRLFAEMVRRLPGEETLIEAGSGGITITSGRATATLQGENPKDFISMPEVGMDFAIRISRSALKRMVKQCIFATAQDESKPILTGVLFEIEEGQLSMVALDGYRLALRREAITIEGTPHNVVVPARSLLEISRIMDDREEEIRIAFSKTHIIIDMGHTRINTRLMDGEFIRYKQILPESSTTHVTIDRRELLESIERVSLMAREGKKNHVRFSFEDTLLTITANSEVGSSKEEVPISRVGSDMEIAFNARFFSDVLKALEDEAIILDMNTNISPCVVTPVEGNEYYYLILPVRLLYSA